MVGNNSHNLFHLNRNSQQHQLRKNESVSSSIGVAAPATRGALKSPVPTTVVVDGHGIQQQQQQQPPTVADMIKKEFKGKHLLQMESSDAEKLRKRIVSKKGVVHIGRSHLDRKQQRRILYDFFNTMLDLKWRYVLLIFSLSFILSWLFFAVIWFLIMYLHGDFEEGHLPDQQVKTIYCSKNNCGKYQSPNMFRKRLAGSLACGPSTTSPPATSSASRRSTPSATAPGRRRRPARRRSSS